MKLINSTNWFEKQLNVNWTDQIEKDGFTEFRYICQCGAHNVKVHINKGETTPISKKIEICKRCNRTNVVPCRKIDRQ